MAGTAMEHLRIASRSMSTIKRERNLALCTNHPRPANNELLNIYIRIKRMAFASRFDAPITDTKEDCI